MAFPGGLHLTREKMSGVENPQIWAQAGGWVAVPFADRRESTSGAGKMNCSALGVLC